MLLKNNHGLTIRYSISAALVLFCCCFNSLNADVKGLGEIPFKLNDQVKMTLNAEGLGIGTVASSANLEVAGNAIISTRLAIGGPLTSSNLHIYGTIARSFENLTAGSNQIQSSMVMADTSQGDVHLILPYAGNVSGRSVQIKRINSSNELFISASGNLMDQFTTLGFGSGNYSQMILYSDGQQWLILGKNPSETLKETAADSLSLWWTLDETSGNVATDHSANASFHGNLNPSFNFSGNSVTGPLQKALAFSYPLDVVYSDGIVQNTSQYSYSFWFKSNTLPQDIDGGIVDLSGNAAFVYSSANIEYRQTAYHRLSDQSLVLAPINSTLSANLWYNLAVTWDGSSIKTYLNGTLESGNTATTWAGAANIAISYPTSFESGNLSMDDIRYFNTSLSQEAIQSLYHAGYSP